MLWFDGSIRNAVDKVKSSGVFLLVFVQGDDNLSKKYETYLNEETRFGSDEYVAIKIPQDSVALQQFKEIYVSVPIPSVFLIQNNGIPFKVVYSSEILDLKNAIGDAILKQNFNKEKKSQKTSSKENLSEVDEKSFKITSKPSQHIKNIGFKVFNVTKEEIQTRLKEIRDFPKFWVIESPLSHGTYHNSPLPNTSARIQFRLPNNTMPSWEFPDLSTLGDVRAYLTEKMDLSSNFKLLRTYPRTAFTPQDESKTLAELSLTPNATLIVVPIEDKTVQAKVKNLIVQRSFVSMMIKTMLQVLDIVLYPFKKLFLRYRIVDTDSSSSSSSSAPQRLPSDTAVEKVFNKKTSTSNIHGFKFDEDPDTDAEHPDNGNSTQQKFQ